MSDEPERIGLEFFPIEKMMTDRLVLILGKRGMGKSFLLDYILSHIYKNFDIGLAASPTAGSRETFAKYIPESLIFDKYDGDKIAKIVDDVKNVMAMGHQARLFVIMDDCMFEGKEILKSKAMSNIHNNGRHSKICVINLAQNFTQVPKDLRNQYDYIFCMATPDETIKRHYYDDFFSNFGSFENFKIAFDVCTEDRGVMVADMTKGGVGDITKTYFWFKAEPVSEHHMMCNRHVWKCHWHLYKPKEAPKALPTIPAFSKNREQNAHSDQQQPSQQVTSGVESKKTSTRRSKSKRKDGNDVIIIKCPKKSKSVQSGNEKNVQEGKFPNFSFPKITLLTNNSPDFNNHLPISLPSAIAQGSVFKKRPTHTQYPTPK